MAGLVVRQGRPSPVRDERISIQHLRTGIKSVLLQDHFQLFAETLLPVMFLLRPDVTGRDLQDVVADNADVVAEVAMVHRGGRGIVEAQPGRGEGFRNRDFAEGRRGRQGLNAGRQGLNAFWQRPDRSAEK